MKGIPGLMIALGLGFTGMICNFFYIARIGEMKETVSFIAIKTGTRINPGDLFSEDQFMQVNIPRDNLGQLNKVAYRWDEIVSIVGDRATIGYLGGELIFKVDNKTQSRKSAAELLGENEDGKWIPVDPRTFVPDRVNPGDYVSFTLPQISGGGASTGTGSASSRPSSRETVGPFRILALGGRHGRKEIQQTSGRSSGSEYTLYIALQKMNGQLETKAERLIELVRSAGFQPAEVTLHSSRMKKKQ
jgi:hypothetical protein